jgi:hypothetical protein
MPTIEGWGNSSRVRSVVEKTGENNQKAGNIGRVVSQVPTLGPKHEKN